MSKMADTNYEKVTKAVNAVANGLELGIEREKSELALLATIAQILAAIVDELHELNRPKKYYCADGERREDATN